MAENNKGRGTQQGSGRGNSGSQSGAGKGSRSNTGTNKGTSKRSFDLDEDQKQQISRKSGKPGSSSRNRDLEDE